VNKTRLAWILALAADALQIVFLPVFGAGALSPLMDALDVAMAISMILLLGWHVAFLPTAIAELVPALNLFPTWTAAVFFVTRRRAGRGKGEVAGDPPGPGNGARRKDLPPGAR
jgi:hypothetical protein